MEPQIYDWYGIFYLIISNLYGGLTFSRFLFVPSIMNSALLSFNF